VESIPVPFLLIVSVAPVPISLLAPVSVPVPAPAPVFRLFKLSVPVVVESEEPPVLPELLQLMTASAIMAINNARLMVLVFDD
jgi:hypothetical protein